MTIGLPEAGKDDPETLPAAGKDDPEAPEPVLRPAAALRPLPPDDGLDVAPDAAPDGDPAAPDGLDATPDAEPEGEPETPPDDDPLTQMHACDGDQATLVDR